MPFFSVVIPVYNRQHQLKRAIDSVLAQDYGDFEIIVVDDGSTDSTPQTISEYGSRIHCHRQENRGVSAARNAGIRLSVSPHIAFLDSDDRWEKQKLAAHKKFIGNNPGIKIHQCEEIWIRDDKRINQGARYTKTGGNIFADALKLCAISPSGVVISRCIFETYGLFDEEMPVCEDYDLWLRITAFENTGLIREKLITRYSGHQGQLSALCRGMDRFRAYSIIKLLDSSGCRLTQRQRSAAGDCAIEKLAILKKGAERRGNSELAILAEKLETGVRAGYYNRKDYQNLLQIQVSP